MPTRAKHRQGEPVADCFPDQTHTARTFSTFEVLIEVREKVLLPANIFLALLQVPG
jgi:hypothetical protein